MIPGNGEKKTYFVKKTVSALRTYIADNSNNRNIPLLVKSAQKILAVMRTPEGERTDLLKLKLRQRTGAIDR